MIKSFAHAFHWAKAERRTASNPLWRLERANVRAPSGLSANANARTSSAAANSPIRATLPSKASPKLQFMLPLREKSCQPSEAPT
jgi:hypothetical protein